MTGSPGTGKSSLVNQLARAFRRTDPSRKTRVAVVAVDPTSPFSGGAVLGDRVRMRDLVGDPGIFIRSMASRGALGGLARATADVVQVFDAIGYNYILIETVGAGQSEVDIARLAHTTIVVEAPGLGDDVQAIKAGILEIADILVVNKADRPGAEGTVRILRSMLEYGHPSETLYHHPHCPDPQLPLPVPRQDLPASNQPAWLPPVLSTVAIHATGIDDLVQAIHDHADYLKVTGEWLQRDRDRLQAELSSRIQAALIERWRSELPDDRFTAIFRLLQERQVSPEAAVQLLINHQASKEA
jgi:LAO/AO transport system kinase